MIFRYTDGELDRPIDDRWMMDRQMDRQMDREAQ